MLAETKNKYVTTIQFLLASQEKPTFKSIRPFLIDYADSLYTRHSDYQEKITTIDLIIDQLAPRERFEAISALRARISTPLEARVHFLQKSFGILKHYSPGQQLEHCKMVRLYADSIASDARGGKKGSHWEEEYVEEQTEILHAAEAVRAQAIEKAIEAISKHSQSMQFQHIIDFLSESFSMPEKQKKALLQSSLELYPNIRPKYRVAQIVENGAFNYYDGEDLEKMLQFSYDSLEHVKGDLLAMKTKIYNAAEDDSPLKAKLRDEILAEIKETWGEIKYAKALKVGELISVDSSIPAPFLTRTNIHESSAAFKRECFEMALNAIDDVYDKKSRYEGFVKGAEQAGYKDLAADVRATIRDLERQELSTEEKAIEYAKKGNENAFIQLITNDIAADNRMDLLKSSFANANRDMKSVILDKMIEISGVVETTPKEFIAANSAATLDA